MEVHLTTAAAGASASDAMDESRSACDSPVYDYTSDNEQEDTGVDKIMQLRASTPTDALSPILSQPALPLITTPMSAAACGSPTTAPSARLVGLGFSASSVRTFPGSAATAATGSATIVLTDSPTAAAAGRNLAPVFEPLELTPPPPTTTAVAAKSASQSNEQSPAPALPTPPPARVSWPIGYGHSQASAKSGASTNGGGGGSAASKGKRKSMFSSHSNSSGALALSQTATVSGSRFAECPICGKTVALVEMVPHMDSKACGAPTIGTPATAAAAAAAASASDDTSKLKRAKSIEGQDVKSSTTTVAAPSSTIAAKPRRTPSDLTATSFAHNSGGGGSSFTCCPVCASSVPLATINHHMDVECAKVMRKREQAAAAAATAAATQAAVSSSVPSSIAKVDHTPPPPPPTTAFTASLPATSGMLSTATSLSQPTAVAPVASTDSGATSANPTPPPAPAPAAHSFFTAGPRAASAFAPHRRGKNDGVKCQILSHFTLSHVPPTSVVSGSVSGSKSGAASDGLFQCEWQDCPPPAASSSSASASDDPSYAPQLTPLSSLSAFHTSTKCQEPAIDQWADVHLHASLSALQGSPPIDLTSSLLPCNTRQARRFRLSPSMLKSLLQKNVRLSRPAAAVRVALQLMVTSVNEFLRRLVVIMVEDAILHPNLPVLVWLTLAHGKANPQCPFVLTHAHVNLLLQMVHDVACVNTKDVLLAGEFRGGGGEKESASTAVAAFPNPLIQARDTPMTMSRAAAALMTEAAEGDDDDDDGDDFMEGGERKDNGLPPSTMVIQTAASVYTPTLLSSLATLTPPQRTLVKSLLTRACFGGSAFDVALMRSYAALWVRRFESENAKCNRQPPAPACTPDGQTAAAEDARRAQAPVRRWLPFLADLYAASRCALPAKLQIVDQPIDVRRVEYLRDDDLVLSAIDGHCSQIVEILAKKEQVVKVLASSSSSSSSGASAGAGADPPAQAREGLLKQLMWEFRGKLTNKQPLRQPAGAESDSVDPKLAAMYKQLKNEIDLAAKRILQQRIEM